MGSDDCKLCNDGMGRDEHLVYLALVELADKDGNVKLNKKTQAKMLSEYINKNLKHLNHTQIIYRLSARVPM